MRNKFSVLAAAMVLVLVSSALVFAEETAAAAQPSVSVGGHIKITLFDRPVSIVKANGAQTGIEKSYGIGFRELDLFISGKINDWISFEVDPKFSASSGATPKFGVTQTVTAGSDYSFAAFGHGKAVVAFKLPYGIDMEVGQVHPKFTAEYGSELFWEESFNGGKFACNNNLGALHDNGIEISKTFEIAGVSLPVYAYLLNGGTETGVFDANNQPGGMIHVEPVWNGLTVLGSVYAAKTNILNTTAKATYNTIKVLEGAAWTKWSAGLMYSIGDFSIRGEFVSGKNEKAQMSGSLNVLSEGYYVKAMYKVLPWLKLYAMHESAMDSTYLTNPQYDSKSPWGYVYAAIPQRFLGTTAGFDIYLADSTMLQFQLDVEQWRTNDGLISTVYTRPFLGMRVTF
jgi:hypothetical protein